MVGEGAVALTEAGLVARLEVLVLYRDCDAHSVFAGIRKSVVALYASNCSSDSSTYPLEQKDSTAPPTAAERPSTGEQPFVISNSWLAANRTGSRKPAKTYLESKHVLSMLKRVARLT